MGSTQSTWESTKGFRIVDLSFIYYGEVALALHLPCFKKSKILRKSKED